MNSGKWTKIPVPSNWETEGFGVYNYGRGKQPESNETGTYRHDFIVPVSWKGKSVNIVFEGVMTDTKVTVNGKSAGPIHQGSFYRFKYDITALLKYGSENNLEVIVKNWSDNPSVNTAEREADYWVFGGIYRPVYLEAKPEEHIERTAIDAKANGSFAANVYLENIRKANLVEAQVLDMDGKAIGESFSTPIEKGMNKATLSQNLNGIKTWSAEFPNRYQVRFSLKSKGKTIHTTTEKFGFRTVALRPQDGIYVNGEKIKMKGVNRHSFWPESGRTTSYQISVDDVNLIKDMNMNAVRMAHYPPDKHFLEVCDSLGLFVLNELVGWQTAYDTIVGRQLVKELVTRDVNHPSIIIWDNGNEGGNNCAMNDFYLYDPQKRSLIHPWAKFRGTDTQHYKSFGCCADGLFNGDDVFFPTEFLHGLYDGGHGAGLEDFWKAMVDHPLSAGGFLWALVDECVERSDKDGALDCQKSNAPDGIVGPFREKEGSYYTIKEVWSPVYLDILQIPSTFDGVTPVHNRFHYTNLNQCEFSWQLVDFPAPEAKETTAVVKQEKQLEIDDIKPWEWGKLDLNLPDNWQKYQGLILTATDPHDREIYTWSWALQSEKQIIEKLLPQNNHKATAQETNRNIQASASGVTIAIDSETGLISAVNNKKGGFSFSGGPLPDTLIGASVLKSINHYSEGNDYVIEAEFDGVLRTVTYRMLGSGVLQIDYAYIPDNGTYNFIGVSFDYPEDRVTGVRYLGRRPYRVWKNRRKGVRLGVWEKAYNNTITGETWEYPEFKGYHDEVYWAEIQTKEQPFGIMVGSNNLFLHLFSPDNPEGAYNKNTDGNFPGKNISILHAISPIGTKFKKPENLGPQSYINEFSANRKRPHYFLEGNIYLDFRER
ncbi:MAG: hypothetical protein KI786_01920 [Mameliella sp.]|nr:hypothetical protein [Phaeodactylibacter sp.]